MIGWLDFCPTSYSQLVDTCPKIAILDKQNAFAAALRSRRDAEFSILYNQLLLLDFGDAEA